MGLSGLNDGGDVRARLLLLLVSGCTEEKQPSSTTASR